jgi:hypothetical protein
MTLTCENVIRAPGVPPVIAEIEVMLETRCNFLCGRTKAQGKQGQCDSEIWHGKAPKTGPVEFCLVIRLRFQNGNPINAQIRQMIFH